MDIIKISEVPQFVNPHGVDAKKLFVSEKVTFVHLTLKPGDSIAPHSAEGDSFFFVLEGEGVASSGEKHFEVQAGTLIKSPAGNLHGWSNVSKNPLKILACKMGA